MQKYRFTIIPESAFGTEMKGDTLFGQLCWAIANRYGEEKLTECLKDYTNNKPFLVVSDAFPAGYLPLPSIPSDYYEAAKDTNPSKRKEIKKRQWLKKEDFSKPLTKWLEKGEKYPFKKESETQAHNTINRLTGTTGKDAFAPFVQTQIWLGLPDAQDNANATSNLALELDIYMVLDESLLSINDLKQALQDIGDFGFGRDASIGLGKFTIKDPDPDSVHDDNWVKPQAQANAWLTLAPCAPQGQAWNSKQCYYKPFTRFGRHGDIAANYANPFKKPILLVDTAAILTPKDFKHDMYFCGQGITGISNTAMKETVHQGYAPVISIHLHENKKEHNNA